MVSDTAEFQVVLRGKTQFRMMGMIFLMLFVFHLASGAPVQDAVKRLGRLPRTHGCYHNGTHYGNGEMIQTLEPCLNCTCTDSQLMCYLRVCPIEQPMRKGCIEEKQKGECCPKIWCPEATKGKKDCNDTDHEGHDHHDEERDEPGCYLDGNYYPEGTMLPKDPDNPCEVCYCIRNNTNCVIQECELNIEGCSPVYIPGQCCPCRYNCSYDETTTVPPGFTVSDLSEGCYDDNGIFFAHDGEPVNSSNPCEHCYCMRNKVVCAIHECRVPSTDCIARETKPGHCCPFQYDCPGNESSVSSTFVGVPVVQSPKVNYGVKTSYHKMIGLAGIQTSATLMSQFRPIVKKVTEPSISSSSAKDAPTSSTTEPTIIERKSSPHYGYDSSTDASTGAEAFKTAQKTSTAFSHSEPSKKHSSVKTVSSKTPGKISTVSAHSHPLAKQPSVETASSSPEKLESNKNKSEPQQFGVKGAFQEVVEFKGTPPPFIRSPVVKPNNTTTIHSASAAQPPVSKSPIVRNKTAPVTAPPLTDEDGPSYGVVRISGHNQSFVVPNVPVSHLRPGSSQGIKGGLKRYNTTKTSITRPDTVPVGVKGTQSPGYSIKGTYPTRQRPLLPLGAIPGESNHPVINNTRPTIMSIPGEAICRVGKKVYRNGESVQSFDVCKMNCQCINSVIYCDDVICASPPKGKKDCVAVHVSNKCCPVYHCDSFSIPVSSATKTPASSSFSPPDEKDLPNTSTPASTIAPISLVKEHSFISVSSIPEKSTVPPQNDLVEKAGVTTDVTAKSEIITAGTSSVEDELTPAVTTEIVATSKSSTTEADEISSVSVTEGEVTKSKLTTTEADGITVASYTTTTPVTTSYPEDKFATASESTAGSIKLTTVNINVSETGVTTDATTKSQIITSGTTFIQDESTPAVTTEIVATSKLSTTGADEIGTVNGMEGGVTKSKLKTTEAGDTTVAPHTTTTPVPTSYTEDKFAIASESTTGSIKLTTVNIDVTETGVTTDVPTKSERTSGTSSMEDELAPAVTTEIFATTKTSTTEADEISTVNVMEGGLAKSKLTTTEANDIAVAPHTTTTPVATSYPEDKFSIASESTAGSIKLTTVNINGTKTGATTDVTTKSEIITSGKSSIEDDLTPAVTTEIVATTKSSTTETGEINTVSVMEGGVAKSKLTTTEADDIAVASHTTTTPVATSYTEDKFAIASESTAGSIKLTTVNMDVTETGVTTDVTTKSEIITSGTSSIKDDLTPAGTTEIVATTKSSTTEADEISTVSVMEGGVTKSKLTTTEADGITVASYRTTTPVATSYQEDKLDTASVSTAGSVKLTTVNINITETGFTTETPSQSSKWATANANITEDELTNKILTELSTLAITETSITEAGLAIKTETKTPKLTTTGASIANGVFTVETSSETVSEKTEFSTTNIDFADLEFTNETITKDDSTQSKLATSIKVGFSDDDLKVTELSTAEEISSTAPDTNSDYQTFISTLAETNASELELSVETATEPAATKSKETTVGERSTIAEDTAEIVTNTSVSKFELTTTEAKSDVTTPKNKLPSAADTETTPALISSTETYHTEGTLVNLENVSSTIQVNKDATSEGTISNFSVNTTDFSKFSSGAYTETTFSTYAKTKYTSSSSVEYITTTSPLIPSESITGHPVDSSNQTFPANESTEASKDVSDFDTNISSKFEDADKTQSLEITTFADTSSVGSPSKPVDLVNEITTESPFHLGTHTSSVGFSSKPVDLVNEITTETPFHLGTHTSSPGEITSTETTDNFTPISTTDIVSDASKVYSPVKLDQDSRILTSSSTAQPVTETSTKVSLKHDIEGVKSTSHSEEYTISDNKIHMNTENYNLLTNQPTELYNTKFFSTSDESIVSDTEATVKPEMIIDSQTTTSSDFTEISQKVTDLPIATDALSSEQGIRIADELGSSKDNFTENTTSTKETTSSNSEIFETSSQTPSAIFTTTGSNSYSEISEINYTVTTSKDLNEDLFIPTTKKHHGNIHDIILTSTISPQTTASHESTIKTSEDISSISSVGTTVLPKIKSTSKPNYFSDSETGKEILESFDTEIKETKATTLQHAINTDMGSLEAQQNLEPTIQSQTSKYPLLISEELSEFQESLKDSDKTLLGHKISQKKPEISDFNFETVQGQIIGVSNSTSISVIHETDSQTHTSNSSKVTKEIPTTTPGPSIQDNVHHDFTTDFTSETKSDVSTTTEYPSSTDVSSISDFTTHTDTIIQRETLPQVPMQSPENLISPPESENIFDSTEKEFSVNAATKSIVTNAIKPVEASTLSDVFKNSSPTSELSESIKPESPEPTTEKGLELTAEKILPAKTLSEVVTKVSVSSDELNVFLQTVTTETRKSSNEMSTESPKKVSEWSSTTLLDNMTTQPTATKPVEEFTTKLDEKSSETSESTTRQQTDFSTQSTTLIPKLPLSSPPIELTTILFNISSEKENFGGDSTFPPNVPHLGLEASTLSDERVKLSTETTRADKESSKDFSHAVSEKDLTSSTSGKPTLDTNLTEEEMITLIDEMVDIPQPPAQDNKNLGTSTQYPGTSIFKNITDSVTSDIPSDKKDHSVDHSVTSLSTIATSHKVFSEISTIESTHSSTINETETTETSTSTEPSIANTYEKTTNIPDISTSSSTTFSQSESDLKSVTTASSIDSNFSEETKLDDTQKYLTHSQEDGMTVTTNPPTKDEHIYETSAPQTDSSILKLGTDSVKSDISSEIMEQSTHYSLTSQSTTEAPLKVFSEISNAESTHPSTIKATEKTETTTSTEPYIANTYEKTTHVPDISISSSTTFSQSESDLKTVTTASSTDSSSSEETRKDNTQKYLTLSQEEGIAATTKPPTTDKQIFETSTPQTDSSNLKHGTDSVKSDIYSEKSEESTDYSATSHTTTEATLKVFSEISTTERTQSFTTKATETTETATSTEPSIANTYEKTTNIPDISTSSSTTFSQRESDLKSVTTASSTDSSFSEETRKDNTQKYLTLSQEEGIAATTNLPTNNNHIFETSTPQTDSSISKLGTDSVQSDIYSEKNEQSTDYSATSHSTTEAPLTVFSEISNAECTHSSKIEATERTTSIQPSIANTYEKTTYVPDISTSSSTTFSQSESDLKTVTTASSTDSSFSEETRKDNTQKYLTLSQEEGIAATTNPPTTDKHIFETSTPETDSSILKLGTDAVKSDIYSEESEQSTDYSATSHSTTEAPLKIFSEISTAESTQSFTTKATETKETATSTEPSIANTYEKTTNIPDISTSSSTTFSQRESDLKSVTTASSTDSNFSEETKKDDTQKYLTLSQEDGMTVTTNPPRKDEHIYETSAPQTDISILKLSTDSVKSDISSEIMEQSTDYSVTSSSITEAPFKAFSEISTVESTHSSRIKVTETTEKYTSTEPSNSHTYEKTEYVPDITTSSSITKISQSESDLKAVTDTPSTDSIFSEETQKDNTQKYLTLSQEDGMTVTTNPPRKDEHIYETSAPQTDISILKLSTDSVKSDISSEIMEQSSDYSVTLHSTTEAPLKVFSDFSAIESTHSSTIKATETTETTTSTESSIANTYEETTDVPDISTSSSTTFSKSESDLKTVSTVSSTDSSSSEETRKDNTQKYFTLSEEEGIAATTNPPTTDKHIFETSTPETDSSILKLGTDAVKSDIYSEESEQSTDYSATSHSTTEAPLKIFSEISTAESTQSFTSKATETTETTTSTEPSIANTYEKTTYVPDISTSSSIPSFSISESDLKTFTTRSSTGSSFSEETRKDETEKYVTLLQEEGIAATTNPPTKEKHIFETSTPQTDSSILKLGTDSVKSDIYSEKTEQSTDYSATSHSTTEAPIKIFSEISTAESAQYSTIKATETTETTTGTEPSIANTYEKTTYVPYISTSSSITTLSHSESDLKTVTSASSTDSSFSEETQKDDTQKHLTLSQEEGMTATTISPTKDKHFFETSTQTDSPILKLGTDSVKSDIYSEKTEKSTDYSDISRSTTETLLKLFSEISASETTHSSTVNVTETIEKTTTTESSTSYTNEKTTYVPDSSASSSIESVFQGESDLKTINTTPSADSSFSEETQKDVTQKFLPHSQEEMTAPTNTPPKDNHIFETSTVQTGSSILKLVTDSVKSDISEKTEQFTDYSIASHSTTDAPLKVFSEISTVETKHSSTIRATETTETTTSRKPSITYNYEKTTYIPDISTSSSITTFSQSESDLKTATTTQSTDSSFSEEIQKDDISKYLTLSQEEGMTDTSNPPTKDNQIFETSTPQTDSSILKLATDTVKSDISSGKTEQSTDYSVTSSSTTESPLKVFSEISNAESTHPSTIKATETKETTTRTEPSIANTYEKTTHVPDISTPSRISLFSESAQELKTVSTTPSADSSFSEETQKFVTQKYLTFSQEEGITDTTNPPTKDYPIFETSTPQANSSIVKLGTDSVTSDISSEETEQSSGYSVTTHSTTEAPVKVISEISSVESTHLFTIKATETTEKTTSPEPSIAYNYEKTTYVPGISSSSSITTFSQSESDLKTFTNTPSAHSSFSEEKQEDETQKYFTLSQEEGMTATTNPPTKDNHIFETSTPQTDSSIVKLATDSVKSDITSEKTEQSTDYSVTSSSITEAPFKAFSEISTVESTHSSRIKVTETTEKYTSTEPSNSHTYEKTEYVPDITTSSSITKISQSESDLKAVTDTPSTDSIFSEETQKDNTQKYLTLSQEDGMTATTNPSTKDKHIFETSAPQTDSSIFKLVTDSVKSDISSEKTEQSSDYSVTSHSTTETSHKLFSEISDVESTHSSTFRATDATEKSTGTEPSIANTYEKTTHVPDISISSKTTSFSQTESDLKTVTITSSTGSSFSEGTQNDDSQKSLTLTPEEGITDLKVEDTTELSMFDTSNVQGETTASASEKPFTAEDISYEETTTTNFSHKEFEVISASTPHPIQSEVQKFFVENDDSETTKTFTEQYTIDHDFYSTDKSVDYTTEILVQEPVSLGDLTTDTQNPLSDSDVSKEPGSTVYSETQSTIGKSSGSFVTDSQLTTTEKQIYSTSSIASHLSSDIEQESTMSTSSVNEHDNKVSETESFTTSNSDQTVKTSTLKTFTESGSITTTDTDSTSNPTSVYDFIFSSTKKALEPAKIPSAEEVTIGDKLVTVTPPIFTGTVTTSTLASETLLTEISQKIHGTNKPYATESETVPLLHETTDKNLLVKSTELETITERLLSTSTPAFSKFDSEDDRTRTYTKIDLSSETDMVRTTRVSEETSPESVANITATVFSDPSSSSNRTTEFYSETSSEHYTTQSAITYSNEPQSTHDFETSTIKESQELLKPNDLQATNDNHTINLTTIITTHKPEDIVKTELSVDDEKHTNNLQLGGTTFKYITTTATYLSSENQTDSDEKHTNNLQLGGTTFKYITTTATYLSSENQTDSFRSTQKEDTTTKDIYEFEEVKGDLGTTIKSVDDIHSADSGKTTFTESIENKKGSNDVFDVPESVLIDKQTTKETAASTDDYSSSKPGDQIPDTTVFVKDISETSEKSSELLSTRTTESFSESLDKEITTTPMTTETQTAKYKLSTIMSWIADHSPLSIFTNTEELSSTISPENLKSNDTSLASNMDHDEFSTAHDLYAKETITKTSTELPQDIESSKSPQDDSQSVTTKGDYSSVVHILSQEQGISTFPKEEIAPDSTVYRANDTHHVNLTTAVSPEMLIYNFTAKEEYDLQNVNLTSVTTTSIFDESRPATTSSSEDVETKNLTDNSSTSESTFTDFPVATDSPGIILYPKYNNTDSKVPDYFEIAQKPIEYPETANSANKKYPQQSSPSGWTSRPIPQDILKEFGGGFPTSPEYEVYPSAGGAHIIQQAEGYPGEVCFYNGEVYQSAEQIPRKDSCEFCFCFRGEIICLQQTCPPPIKGCYAIPIDNFCCPRFHCPVQQLSFNNTSQYRTTTAVPLGKHSQKTVPRTGCKIDGQTYRLHDIVHPATNPCMLCRCDYGGIMKCEPRDCHPGVPFMKEIADQYFKRK